MATYCVDALAFLVDGTNSSGEQFRNHLYRLIFLLRRRFLFLSSSQRVMRFPGLLRRQ